MTIEQTTNDHHGGRHVKQVKLPALPPAKRYSMLVMSAYIPAGLTSRIHTHSGVAWMTSNDSRFANNECAPWQRAVRALPLGPLADHGGKALVINESIQVRGWSANETLTMHSDEFRSARHLPAPTPQAGG